MRRRPGIKEWLATALSVTCVIAIANQLRRTTRPADDEVALARLRSERTSLAGHSDERLSQLRGRDERGNLQIGPEWRVEESPHGKQAYRAGLGPDAWPEVLADLRSLSSSRLLQAVQIKADDQSWTIRVSLWHEPP